MLSRPEMVSAPIAPRAMGTEPGRSGGHQGCRESQGESELKHQAQKWQKGIEGGELGVERGGQCKRRNRSSARGHGQSLAITS